MGSGSSEEKDAERAFRFFNSYIVDPAEAVPLDGHPITLPIAFRETGYVLINAIVIEPEFALRGFLKDLPNVESGTDLHTGHGEDEQEQEVKDPTPKG